MKRRFYIKYNPTGSYDGKSPAWEVWDRLYPQGPYEGGYSQAGARAAAHFHNRDKARKV